MKYFFPQRKLTTLEYLFVPEVIIELSIARIKVNLLPSLKYLPVPSGQTTSIHSNEKFETGKIIVSVINGLSSRTPFSSTCLVKVLAANKLLVRRKILHTLHFGVKKDKAKKFNAHAWLSINDTILLGGENLYDFHEIYRIVL